MDREALGRAKRVFAVVGLVLVCLGSIAFIGFLVLPSVRDPDSAWRPLAVAILAALVIEGASRAIHEFYGGKLDVPRIGTDGRFEAFLKGMLALGALLTLLEWMGP